MAMLFYIFTNTGQLLNISITGICIKLQNLALFTAKKLWRTRKKWAQTYPCLRHSRRHTLLFHQTIMQ